MTIMLGSTLKRLRAAVDRLEALPVSPETLQTLYYLARNHPQDLTGISLVAWSEPGLAIELMARSQAGTFAGALSELGPERLRAYAHERLLLETLRPAADAFPMEKGWLDACLLTAIVSEHFAAAIDSEHQEEAYLAGLLSDIGSLVAHTDPVSGAWREVAQADRDAVTGLAGKWTAARFGLRETIGHAIWLQSMRADALPDEGIPLELIDIVGLARELVHGEHAAGTLAQDGPRKRLARLRIDSKSATAIWEESLRSFHEVRKRFSELRASTPDTRSALADDVRRMLSDFNASKSEAEALAEYARRAELRERFAVCATLERAYPALARGLAHSIRELTMAAQGLCYLIDPDTGIVDGCAWSSLDGTVSHFASIDFDSTDGRSHTIREQIEVLQRSLNTGGGNTSVFLAGLVAVPIRTDRGSHGQVLFDAGAITGLRQGEIVASVVAMAQVCAARIERIASESRAELAAESWALHAAAMPPQDASRTVDAPAPSPEPRVAPVVVASPETPDFPPSPIAEAPTPPFAQREPAVPEVAKSAPPSQLHLEPALVNLMAKQVLAEFGALANVRGVRLVHDLAEGLPRVRVDRGRMRLALRTLLHGMLTENAEGGQIRVSTRANATRNQVILETANRLPATLDAHTSTGARRVDMKTLQSLVEQQDGKVTTGFLENGYTIAIALPAATERVLFRSTGDAATAPKPSAPAKKSVSSARTVLIIEENRELREVLAETLKHRGLAVAKLSSVTEGAEACKRHRFDVVLVDLPAPGEAARTRLSQLTPHLHGTPVVAVVSGAGAQELLEISKYGVEACLSKPFELGNLLSQLSHIFTKYPPVKQETPEKRQTA